MKLINGAVIGRPQSGKTALINSMLELYGTTLRPAETPNMNRGDVKTTVAPNYCLQLSELPDPSFLDFMIKTRYPDKYKLKTFDFFVIFVETRNKENVDMDNWLIDYIANKLYKQCYLVLSHVDKLFHGKGPSMNLVYSTATEAEQERIRNATFSVLRDTLTRFYPNKTVYLMGREQPNSPLGLEFAEFWAATEVWRKTIEQMPSEEGIALYSHIADKVSKYVMGTTDVGESVEDYSAEVLTIMNEAPETTINGCVIGPSGVGKSAFINSFFEIYACEEGVVQTTMVANKISSRDAPLTITDLPGFGTNEFPKEKYAQQFELASYDFIVLMVNPNNAPNFGLNKWMYDHVKKELKIPCYIVRSFFDHVVTAKAANINPTLISFTDEQMKEAELDARAEILQSYKNDTVYLIGKDVNSKTPKHDYDFQKLKDTIHNDLPKYLQESLISQSAEFTDGWISEKSGLLTKYMIKYSAVSSAAGACPVPGPSIAVDMALLTLFAKRCKDVYRLNDDSLKVLLSPEQVVAFTIRIAATISACIAAIVVASSADDALKVVPVVGTIIGMAVGVVFSGPILYASMYGMRRSFIQILREVLKERVREVSSNNNNNHNIHNPPL